MSETVESRIFIDENGRVWEARYVPDWAGVTLPDAKVLEFVPADPTAAARSRVPVRPGFLEAAREEQLRAALAASI